MNKKTESTFIWSYLIEQNKLDLIDLMAKSDRREVKKIIIKRTLVPDLIVHNTIIKYLENNGVVIIRKDIKR
jgi:hypothetical protein